MSTNGGTFPDARELGRRSMAAVEAKDREAWLALFADDGVVEDPIGPSPFDPEAKGHRGREGIAAFYDNVIATNDGISFEIERSYLCGNECANVGIIRTVLTGGKHVAVVRGVYTYRSNGAGKLAALRAFWEFDKVELLER
ncbi:MAG TPA: nuclear transport factor 2 family protein [Acidimicrobiales bacterium]|nr:nuclear transport factor 2 family protein [Acidimicrobiales bacterium]